MGTEVAVRARDTVLDDIRWARALAGASDVLPVQYRGKPGNLIVAAQLARSLGVHPMVAVTGIYVIDGKPSTSAALISALVRRAGHRLRVVSKNSYATAYIVRNDDPDFTFEVTWRVMKGDHDDPSGEQAGLLSKANWIKYSGGMCASRAISGCARLACEEALMGIHYTAEELNPDMDTDKDGGAIRAERISFEDMYKELITNAATTDELTRYFGEAKAAGVLKMIPTGEERTVLQMLNDRMRDIKATLVDREEEEKEEKPQAEEAEKSYLKPSVEDESDPAYAQAGNIYDAEIVADTENEVL